MKSLIALVGMKHRPGMTSLVARCAAGEPLTLVRDYKNIYDRNAVMVFARGEHVGFLKATQNRAIADRLDALPADAVITAKLAIDGGKWPMVEIEE